MTLTLHKTVSLVIAGLDPDRFTIHVDDSRDGSFSGMTPTCDGCGQRVGYSNGEMPSTMEEADAATFIPCVDVLDASYQTTALYCVPCVLNGTMIEDLEDA